MAIGPPSSLVTLSYAQRMRLRLPRKFLWLSTLAAAFLASMIVAFVGVQKGYVANAPSLSLHYNDDSPYDKRKVALMVENRPSKKILPILLHFTATIPFDWRVRVMGSPEVVESLNASRAIRTQVAIGKMDLTLIPSNMSLASGEDAAAFYTERYLWETVLAPAEWILHFEEDAILCSNSDQSLNDWLEYDYVGAPWYSDSRYGGNSGLTMLKVSAVVDMLRHQKRPPNTGGGDIFLSERLGQRKGAKMANGTTSQAFSAEYVESVRPMGYHTGSDGTMLPGANWGTPEKRRDLYEYCPEIKMMLHMDHEKYLPGDCGSHWKREAAVSDKDEIYLPAGLTAF